MRNDNFFCMHCDRLMSCSAEALAQHVQTQRRCADPSRHSTRVSRAEREGGELRAATLRRTRSSIRQCGFVKILDVLDVGLLATVQSSMQALLTANPHTPLLNVLRQAETSGRTGRAERLEVGLPWVSPFNTSELVNGSLLRRLVGATLGKAALGVELDIAAYISVGPRAPAQEVHNDIDYSSRHLRWQSRFAIPQDARKLLEAMAPDLRSGAATYGLNVQVPLVRVNETNAPTHLCPGSHSDDFCDAHLGGLCTELWHVSQ